MSSPREEAMEKAKKAAARGHPALRGPVRRERYTHGLGAAQMGALRAMCGALIPALPAEHDGARGGGDMDAERFYLATAAESTVPDEVAELTMTRCVWEAGVLVRIILWILATRVGTLALCGRRCISGEFPYVGRFADMPVERREEVLRRWSSTRWLFPLKITFALIKVLCHFVFYTAVDENSENPSWKAIGYSVPAAEEEPRKEPTEATPAPATAPPCRPLDNGVVETKQLDDNALLMSLAEKGLALKTGASSSAHHHTVLCDVVVVGSGCGGGVAAAVLASAGYKVVVVEKGDYFATKDYSSLEGPTMERIYENGGVFSTANVTTTIFAGATVGGGSAGLALKTGASSSAHHHTVLCDVVVVGSGCGGGVAAAVLASAGYKVVVVEKGDYFATKDYSSLEGPTMERIYENGGVFSTANVTTTIFAGATVGGGSAVNWSACIRTPENVLQEWSSDHGLQLFGGPGYMQAMDAVCARLGVTGRCREEGFQNKVVRRGCEALGLRVEAVPRNSGTSAAAATSAAPPATKRGTDTTWLVDAVERGAVILTGCKAEQFHPREERGGGAAGARSASACGDVQSNGITKKLRIEAKVSISACGALMTPPLLHKSGLKNRHIGRNLHLHPVSMAWGYFPDNTPEPHIQGKCYEGGIITSMHRVTDRTIIETPALGPGAFAALVPWESGRDMKERMRRYARTAHAFALVRDRGAGFVDGEGRLRYAPSHGDTEELRAGLRRALRILVAAGAAEVGTHRSDGLRLRCKGVRDEDVEAFLDEVTVEKGPMHSTTDKWSVLCSAHQMGSCRMGASPSTGAVDGAGESWEAEGLYVCDGSLLPTAVGVNPMITIQSIAYCVAKGIADAVAHGKEH
uniref:long-chain-alcohol oxidase n=1 Tax=Oryza punctata TaxID=4537 RepID=A0A0E0M8N3_ORYPU